MKILGYTTNGNLPYYAPDEGEILKGNYRYSCPKCSEATNQKATNVEYKENDYGSIQFKLECQNCNSTWWIRQGDYFDSNLGNSFKEKSKKSSWW
jgi:hypothetical protein